jgi:SAM-dependent methyltransferase
MHQLLEGAVRRSAEGRPPRVLLAGPVGQVTVESIAGAGCRLTVEGEFFPALPLAYPDGRFDLVLGLDVLDLLPDDRARMQAAEWARVLGPGGTLYLIARRDPAQVPPLVRIDVHPDGGLAMCPLGQHHPLVLPRQNREFEVLVRPLAVHEISLRRDGLREILCRKQG